MAENNMDKGRIRYVEPTNTGFYSTTESEKDLKAYFANVMTEITTKITREIILHTDTIIRDIMGEGFLLTEGTVIKAYKQAGTYNAAKGGIDWAVNASGNPILEEVATLEMVAGTCCNINHFDVFLL